MLNFNPAQYADFSDAFHAHINAAMESKNAASREVYKPWQRHDGKTVERPTVTAGVLGRECTRSIAYEFHRYDKDPGRDPKGPMLRIFDRGHQNETNMAQYLQSAGFTLLLKNAKGQQFRFDQLPYEDGKGRLKGMADGVITDGPAKLGDFTMAYPCLWENKEVKSKVWNALKKHGLKKEKPEYYTQVQLLMGYLDLWHNPTLFTAKCADTQEIHADLVRFDPEEAQNKSDRAVRVVQSKSPEDFPRIATDPTNFKCRFCDYHDTCWAVSAEPVQAMPSWLANKVQAQ